MAIDHKPLLKILRDKDIENPRLKSLKEKTLRYKFRCVHFPGKDHSGTDFNLRYPVGP